MSPNLRLFMVAVVTLVPAYLLAFQRPPILDRELLSRTESASGCSPKFEFWTPQSGLAKMGMRISERSNFMTPIVVIDANSDGFPDIFLTGEADEPNLLFINRGDGRFVEKGKEYGVGFKNPAQPTAAVFYDYNLDGRDDLILAYERQVVFLKRSEGKSFSPDRDRPPIKIGQVITGMNIADLQGDGEPDLILSSFVDLDRDRALDVPLFQRRYAFLTGRRYSFHDGGKKLILYHEKGRFRDEFDESLPLATYAQTVGVSDIDEDGRPDLFFSNDFCYDQLFLNRGQGKFVEDTERWLPKLQHGISGMNAEFYDYNRDGKIDLFVSNIFQKNFYHSGNLLWEKTERGFVNRAGPAGVTDCGFAWGGKFGDLDNDGLEDLFVTNGLFHMPNVSKPEDARSLWYLKYEMSQIPGPVKKNYIHSPTERDEMASFQPKCLFMQREGKFQNMALEAGIRDSVDRRVVALTDIDNDGRLDLLLRGNGGLEVFRNRTECGSNSTWVGFRFKSKKGSVVNPGLRVTFDLDNGQKIVREIYPAHGFNVYGDSRIHIGLGGAKISSDVVVTWPGQDKKQSRYKNGGLKYGSYNELREI